MKQLARIVLLAFLACAAAGSASALGLAYGGGGSLNFSPVTFDGTYSGAASQVTSQVSSTSLQFFDATYVMVQVGYFLNRGSTEPTAASTTTAFAAVLTGLSLGVSLKLPIRVGPVAVFPIVGAEYVLNLSYTDDKGNDLKGTLSGPAAALNELWIKGGIGLDVFLGDLFLRPVIMAGFKPYAVQAVTSVPPPPPPPSNWSLTLGLGSYTIQVYLLFGYRF